MTSPAPATPLSSSTPTPTPPAGKGTRLEALDGLRGLAAIIVFAHHAMMLLYGRLGGINRNAWPVRPRLGLELLQHAPLGWMFNGAFAVSFFFVLSGLVLTRAMGAAPTTAKVAQLVSCRFLRLLPLVVLGSLVGWALFPTYVRHLDLLRTIAGTDSIDYIHADLLAHHGLGQAIKQAFAGIWRGSLADRLFDPPLWSIGVELQGSLLVYFLTGAFVDTPRRSAKYVVGAAVGLCLIGTASLSFLAGMALAERTRTHGERLLPFGPLQLVAALALALVWASVHPWNRGLWLPFPVQLPELLDTAISTVCAVFVMAAGLQLPALRRLLSGSTVQFFGTASYGLYVAHVPILYVACGPAMRWLEPQLGYHPAVLVTCTGCLALALGVGYLLVRHVDNPLAARSKAWVHGWLKGDGAASAPTP